MERQRAFALCADDYAMAPGVSRGILEALDAGALSATSAMTTSDWWPDHAAALRPFAERADIGLHLNLTLGRPLGAMPILAPGEQLPRVGEVLRRARRGKLPLDEIEAEIERQAARFVEVFGRPPDHVDGHQHVHALRPIRQRLLAVLGRRGWRPWLRDSGDHPLRILRRRTCLLKAFGLAVLSNGLRAAAGAAALPVNDGFAGFSAFAPDEAYAALFESYLVAPGPCHLVMCHPGYVDAELKRLDPVVGSRERELAFLLSPAFGEVAARRVMRLARLSAEIGARAGATG